MLDDPAFAALLAGSDLASLVVGLSSGPLLTPVLFAVRDDRLWMVMPSASAKIRAMGRNPMVGVTVRSPTGVAVMQGTARLVDPLRPSSLVASLPETLLSPRAMGSYVAGNLSHLIGLAGPAALAPRTLAAVRPTSSVTIDDAGHVVGTNGSWPVAGAAPSAGSGTPREDTPELELDHVPGELRRLVDDPCSVIAGWTNANGPVGVPGTWDPERRVVRVQAAVFEQLGSASDTAASILFDATEGTTLAGKAGLVVRGAGSAQVRGGDVELQVAPQRVTWWQGATLRTVDAR